MKKALIVLVLAIIAIVQLTPIAFVAAFTLGTSETGVIDEDTTIINGVVYEPEEPVKMSDPEYTAHLEKTYKQNQQQYQREELAWYAILIRDFFEDTVYTEGFSQDKFEKISVGMSKKEVKETLGEPFYEQKFGDEKYLYYSKNPSGGDFFNRVVVLSKNETVLGKQNHYYAD